MVMSLVERGLNPLDIDQFSRRDPGFWLRHDVELSLDAAVSMAQVEADIGVPSSYFLCVESPFITGDRAEISAAIDELQRLDRDVSYHLVLSPGEPSIAYRLRALRRQFPSIRPRSLTFHASGIPVAALAAEWMGATVYQPLADQVGHYFSDSTGRWRWGHPDQAILTADVLVQILTHPFWWSGNYVAATVESEHATLFLPQLASAELERVAVAPNITST